MTLIMNPVADHKQHHIIFSIFAFCLVIFHCMLLYLYRDSNDPGFKTLKMGKKVMSHQASLKITKQNNHHEGNNNKKQLNSLIEVLRPKVYITDSSNFKRLVQELTGNGSSSSTIPFPASPRWTETVLELENNTPVIDIIEDDRDIQASMDAFDSFESCHNIVSAEGFGEAENRMYLNDATYDMSSTNQSGEDWLAYHDLETWLLDIEQPCPSFNGVMQNQEASLYDYELSSLI